jgi:hypothetical protein
VRSLCVDTAPLGRLLRQHIFKTRCSVRIEVRGVAAVHGCPCKQAAVVWQLFDYSTLPVEVLCTGRLTRHEEAGALARVAFTPTRPKKPLVLAVA